MEHRNVNRLRFYCQRRNWSYLFSPVRSPIEGESHAALTTPTFLSSSLPSPLSFGAMNFHFLHVASFTRLLLFLGAAWPHVAMIDQLNVINKSAKKAAESRGACLSV